MSSGFVLRAKTRDGRWLWFAHTSSNGRGGFYAAGHRSQEQRTRVPYGLVDGVKGKPYLNIDAARSAALRLWQHCLGEADEVFVVPIRGGSYTNGAFRIVCPDNAAPKPSKAELAKRFADALRVSRFEMDGFTYVDRGLKLGWLSAHEYDEYRRAQREETIRRTEAARKRVEDSLANGGTAHWVGEGPGPAPGENVTIDGVAFKYGVPNANGDVFTADSVRMAANFRAQSDAVDERIRAIYDDMMNDVRVVQHGPFVSVMHGAKAKKFRRCPGMCGCYGTARCAMENAHNGPHMCLACG